MDIEDSEKVKNVKIEETYKMIKDEL